jgi:toxin YoeB
MAREAPLGKILLTPTAQEDLAYWEENNPRTIERIKMIERINRILVSIIIDPERGIGKPEKLKYKLSGTWSRRINYRDRIVYKVIGDAVIVLQLRDHY